MVASVQAKGNALRVRLFQKGFDLVLMLDVGLDSSSRNRCQGICLESLAKLTPHEQGDEPILTFMRLIVSRRTRLLP